MTGCYPWLSLKNALIAVSKWGSWQLQGRDMAKAWAERGERIPPHSLSTYVASPIGLTPMNHPKYYNGVPYLLCPPRTHSHSHTHTTIHKNGYCIALNF